MNPHCVLFEGGREGESRDDSVGCCVRLGTDVDGSSAKSMYWFAECECG